MSGIEALDDYIIEFNDPHLGIDVQRLQQWTREVKETAAKTDQLAEIVMETRMAKWTTLEDLEVAILTYGYEAEKECRIEESAFKEAFEDIKQYVDQASSYCVVFTMKAYQSNDTLVGSISRRFGRIDTRDLNRLVHEPARKAIAKQIIDVKDVVGIICDSLEKI